jgi:glycosyltransferase involved in cell wall biosynthesis
VRLVLWHGYLLSGTGSNIYTAHVARAWGRLGHDVTVVCQEPHPSQFDLGANGRVVRPDIGPLLPVFVVDRYEGVEARHVADFTPAELDRYLTANVDAVRAELKAARTDLVLANHAIMGGPVAAAACATTGTPYAIKLHGSELEYAIRGRPRLAAMARAPLDGAAAVYAGSGHIEDVARELLGDGPYEARMQVVPPGVDVDEFSPQAGSRERLFELLAADRAGAHPERHPDPGAAATLQGVGPFVLYFGKLLRQKGVHVLLGAWRELAPRYPEVTLVVVGFGSDREWLEEQAGERVVFTGAMDHAQLQALVPLAEAAVVPSVLPEAFGMVAAEAASCGVVPVVPDHSGLAEVAAGLGDAGRTFNGTVPDLVGVLDRLLSLPPAERRALGLLGRKQVQERWSWEGIGRRLLEGAF